MSALSLAARWLHEWASANAAARTARRLVATLVTELVWPLSTARSAPVAAAHMRAVVST
jgi:hypothetical protein